LLIQRAATMANNRDTILLETVRTHRARLLAAFLFGELPERRLSNDNVKRLIGSIVLAAVVCTGCVGFSLITSVLARQAAARAAQQAKGPVVPGISDQPYAADYFDRTVGRGWGSAELGGRWVTSGPDQDYAVRRGFGVMDVPAGRSRLAYLNLNRETADLTTTVRMDELGSSVSVIGRRVAAEDYRLVVRLTPSRGVSAALVSRQAGKVVPLSNTVGLLGRYQARQGIRVRLQVFGVSPATLRAKVWPAGEEEPQAWTVTAQDNYEPLLRGGAVGIGANRSNEEQPLQVRVTELVIRPVLN
jgi:hypothetical protein